MTQRPGSGGSRPDRPPPSDELRARGTAAPWRRRASRVLVGAVALCLVLPSAGTAVADAPAAPPETRVAPTGTSGVSLVAGYLDDPSGLLTSASTRFKVPTVKCHRSEPRAVSVGLGDTTDLEAPRLRAHLVLDCPPDGPASTSLVVQACGDEAGPLMVKHGRKVLVSLAQSGSTITATATDERSGESISATSPTAQCDPAGPVESVLFGAFPVYAPALLDVPNFNKIKSRDATVNGQLLSGDKYDRQTKPGIKAGPLEDELPLSTAPASARAGDSFVLRYRKIVHCCLRQPSAWSPGGPGV